MSDNHRIVINHSLNKAPENPQAEAARKQREETSKTVRARREQIRQQAREDVAGTASPQPKDPTPAPPRENIETIEFSLSDGRVIEYGPPLGVSLQDRILRMYSGRAIQDGGPDPGISEYRMTRVLMGVRTVAGKAATCNDLVQRTRLANLIGDEGLDLLHYFDRLHWPPMTEAELPVVRKNYKTQPSEG